MVNMITCLLCPRKHTLVLGTGRVHPYCHHFVRSLFFQFPGRLAWLDTRLRVPVPLFALVESVRLSFMYTFQTRSTRWVFPVQKNTCGMNATSAYSAKVFDSPFGEICTTPSMTVIFICEVFVTAESLLV